MSDIVTKPKITAWLKPTCGWSSGVRAVMRKYDLPYEDRDIINDPAHRAEMIERSGQMLSPCVEVNGTMLADARMEIEEFENAYGPLLSEEEREEDIDTLGGLVFTLAGRVPARGELIEHPASGLAFEVVQADPRRIKRLRIRKSQLPAPEAKAGGKAKSSGRPGGSGKA